MFQLLRDDIYKVLTDFAKSKESVPEIVANRILIEMPGDDSHGDLYTNAALMFAKSLKASPRILAESIAEELEKNELVSSVEIAGPGFVNIKLNQKAYEKCVNEILTKAHSYSYDNIVNSEKMNVEFVSANPTGPLHTGHARNAVFGSIIANLLEKVGYVVTREFYINDKGNQIKALARSLYLRYREVLGADVSESDFKEGMYLGDYVKDLARDFVAEHSDSFLNKDEKEWIETFRTYAVNKLLDNIKEDLARIGVVMDVYTSERSLCERNLVDDALTILESRGDIYEGILPKPLGTVSDDWEGRPQTLFRSTKYGDDIDRAIKKSDGSWTYFAGDLAYHLDKFRRGFNKMVAVLGADHNGYVKRLKAAVSALSEEKASIDVQLYQLVNFFENGEQVKMSKRSGKFITLRDVLDRVGKDTTRFMMVSRDHNSMIDFDFVKVIEHSMSNPIFYIQYAYARICSVFRLAEKTFGPIDNDMLQKANKMILTDDSELKLIRVASYWKECVKGAALALEPHRIASYLHDVAYCLHSLWNKGKSEHSLRFIDEENKDSTLSRLALLKIAKIVIEDGFNIIGVTPLEEMV